MKYPPCQLAQIVNLLYFNIIPVFNRLQTLLSDYKCLLTESAVGDVLPLLHQIHSQIFKSKTS
jgi:hypothetical protein